MMHCNIYITELQGMVPDPVRALVARALYDLEHDWPAATQDALGRALTLLVGISLREVTQRRSNISVYFIGCAWRPPPKLTNIGAARTQGAQQSAL